VHPSFSFVELWCRDVRDLQHRRQELILTPVKITNGDTLYVLDANHAQNKIRVAGIDAHFGVGLFGSTARV
jgi:endonuclease YncB( thermonuclease family)